MVPERLREILYEFGHKMKEKGIPYYEIGSVHSRDGTPVLEIVVRRPERWDSPEICARIPKSFRGVRVIVS